MATTTAAAAIHGSGAAGAAGIGAASKTNTVSQYIGDGGGDFVAGFSLTLPHSNAGYSFADPDLLAAIQSDDVVARFVDEGVEEPLWTSGDDMAAALLVELKNREQGRLLSAAKSYYAGSAHKQLALIELRMALSV